MRIKTSEVCGSPFLTTFIHSLEDIYITCELVCRDRVWCLAHVCGCMAFGGRACEPEASYTEIRGSDQHIFCWLNRCKSDPKVKFLLGLLRSSCSVWGSVMVAQDQPSSPIEGHVTAHDSESRHGGWPRALTAGRNFKDTECLGSFLQRIEARITMSFA